MQRGWFLFGSQTCISTVGPESGHCREIVSISMSSLELSTINISPASVWKRKAGTAMQVIFVSPNTAGFLLAQFDH